MITHLQRSVLDAMIARGAPSCEVADLKARYEAWNSKPHLKKVFRGDYAKTSKKA